MCGIAGKYDFKRNRRIDEDLIRRMCSRIIHRGPDDEGYYVEDCIGLGMRRLSIIDVEGGRQPVFNEDKTIVIVYNGETYNFMELRRLLERKGHRFYTETDTEALVHAYEEYGLDFIKKIRGMFAFALWDSRKKRLILARDRMGQKPLYYKHKGGTLWFCSEVKSMLADPLVEREVDLQSLDYYLTFNYVPAPHTIFGGINKLPPAAMLICENGKIDIQKYWTLDNSFSNTMGENECVDHLYDLLSESVKMRLISDVPLGAFLSGGIDSSIIVGLMAEHSSSPVKTFSIGFTESEFSELEYARVVAERFATDHHEYVVTSDVADLIPKLIWHFSEPAGDSSAIPTYYVSRMTRQSVTVALSGDGGDEQFAGYGKYPIIKNIVSKNSLNGLLRSLAGKLILNQDLSFLPVDSIFKRIQKSLGYRYSPPKDRDYMWITHFDDSFKNQLYSPEIKSKIEKQHARAYYDAITNQSPNKDVFSQILFMDLTSYLPDDLLTKVDMASMANSLEVRSPFLDHKFVEFAVALPNSLKLRNGITKYVLKKAFARLLPDKILERPKMGFSIPIDKWFRRDLRDLSYEIMLGGNNEIKNYFDQKFVRYLLDAHCSGAANHGTKLWLLLNFALWHEIFFKEFRLPYA
jgi:asparagine synthase (glutamine-hydrolysing)